MTSNSATNPAEMFARLYISSQDLSYAASFAEYLIKKGLHFNPWERRWPTNVLQSAFTASLIIFYARPFTKSFGLPDFPIALLRYNKSELTLHRMMINLRHQVYAHSDGNQYRIEPVRIRGRASAIVGAPFFKLTGRQVECLQRMIKKALVAVEQEIESLMNQLDGVKGSESLSPRDVLVKMKPGDSVRLR